MFIHTATPFITLHRKKRSKKKLLILLCTVREEERIKNTCGFSPSSLFSYFLLLSHCTVPSFIHFYISSFSSGPWWYGNDDDDDDDGVLAVNEVYQQNRGHETKEIYVQMCVYTQWRLWKGIGCGLDGWTMRIVGGGRVRFTPSGFSYLFLFLFQFSSFFFLIIINTSTRIA